MFSDLDETLRRILTDRIPIKNGEIEIKFDQPKREWSARLSKPTVNMFLYDIRENPQLRRQEFERLRHNGRMVTEQRTSYRLDCLYMITTWAAEPEDEHRLMARVMRALFQFPYLPKETLVGKLKGQGYDIPIQLARHDKLTNPAEIWSSLDNEIRPSVNYIVTLEMNPWEEVSGPAVRNLTMQTRLGADRITNTVASEMHSIGGLVRQGEATIANIQVAFKDTGFVSITDANGRYRLGSVPPGDYTLVVWPPNAPPQEKPITISRETGQYDIELMP